MTQHLDLLHRARNALIFPTNLLDKEALIADLNDAIRAAYPKRPKKTCYCGEVNCNEHTDQNVGDG